VEKEGRGGRKRKTLYLEGGRKFLVNQPEGLQNSSPGGHLRLAESSGVSRKGLPPEDRWVDSLPGHT